MQTRAPLSTSTQAMNAGKVIQGAWRRFMEDSGNYDWCDNCNWLYAFVAREGELDTDRAGSWQCERCRFCNFARL